MHTHMRTCLSLQVGPLSTLSNWINETKRFLPCLTPLLYHGNKQERASLRAQHLDHKSACLQACTPVCLDHKRVCPAASPCACAPGPQTCVPVKWCQPEQLYSKQIHAHTHTASSCSVPHVCKCAVGTKVTEDFPLIVTSYEILIADSKFLSKVGTCMFMRPGGSLF